MRTKTPPDEKKQIEKLVDALKELLKPTGK